MRALVLAAVVVTALLAPRAIAATAGEETGGIGLRLLEVPVAAKDDPRARIYIVDHLAPGEVITRQVEVSNSARSPHGVALYVGAATVEDGVFAGAEGSTANDLSRWSSVTPSMIDLDAGETRTAVVTISVPDDAAPGEQFAVVWAEASSDAATGAVIQLSRVGIRLYVSVGPGAAPAPDFSVESLTPARSASDEPMLTATVRNSGGRALDVEGTLMLSNGPGGLSAGPFHLALNATLAVGDTRDLTIALDVRLPAGPWDATVELRSGVTERRGEARITFPDSGEGASVATSSDSRVSQLLTIGAAAVTITLGGAGIGAARRSRRRRAASPPRHLARRRAFSL